MIFVKNGIDIVFFMWYNGNVKEISFITFIRLRGIHVFRTS